MRKITFTFGKKRSYERYYEQYMNLIGMDNLEKSRSLIIEKIKRTAAKADERGFLLSILEDYEYDDPNEKENVKTVNLNIVCKVKRK